MGRLQNGRTELGDEGVPFLLIRPAIRGYPLCLANKVFNIVEGFVCEKQ